MTMYGVFRRLRNRNLRQVCSHLGADELDARRRGEEHGCIRDGEPMVLIEAAAIHDPAEARATNGKVAIVG